MKSTIALLGSVILVPATSGFLRSTTSTKAPYGTVATNLADIADAEDDMISFTPAAGAPNRQLQGGEEALEECRLPTQKGKLMSESIPFLQCPPVLLESDLAGNVGFDPLGLAVSNEQLLEYREAEIKHARLAMLAAIGWPVSEVEDRDIANYFEAPSVLDDVDRVPSILNGGFDRIDPRFWGFCLGLSAAIDMYGVSKSRQGRDDYFPGNLGFDPLNLFPPDREGQENMKLAEIKHGRIAMLGVVSYVFEENFTNAAVVNDTPILFQPITETLKEGIEIIQGIV